MLRICSGICKSEPSLQVGEERNDPPAILVLLVAQLDFEWLLQESHPTMKDAELHEQILVKGTAQSIDFLSAQRILHPSSQASIAMAFYACAVKIKMLSKLAMHRMKHLHRSGACLVG